MGKLEEADKQVVLSILREHAALLRWAERVRFERDRLPQGDRQPEWAYHAPDDVDRAADELQRTGWLQPISTRQSSRPG